MDSIMEPGPSEGRELGQEEDTNNQQRNNKAIDGRERHELRKLMLEMAHASVGHEQDAAYAVLASVGVQDGVWRSLRADLLFPTSAFFLLLF